MIPARNLTGENSAKASNLTVQPNAAGSTGTNTGMEILSGSPAPKETPGNVAMARKIVIGSGRSAPKCIGGTSASTRNYLRVQPTAMATFT